MKLPRWLRRLVDAVIGPEICKHYSSAYLVMRPTAEIQQMISNNCIKLPASRRRIFFQDFATACDYARDVADGVNDMFILSFKFPDDMITHRCGKLFEFNYDIDLDEYWTGIWSICT